MSEHPRPEKSIPRDQELQIRFALHAAGIGTWDVDILNRQIVLDERCRILFCLEETEEPTYESVIRHIYPADQPAIREVIKQALQPDSDHLFNVRFRCINEENTNVVWLNVKGQVYFNKEGIATRLSGISQDVTAEVTANAKALAAEKMATLAVEGSDAGIFTIDLISNTIDFSANLFYIMTGNRNPVIKDREVLISHVHPDDRILREQAYKEAEKTGSLHYEARFIWDDGSIHWGKVRGKYEYDISGTPVSFSGICLDITVQKEQDRLLKEVEQRFSLSFNNAAIGMAFLDGKGGFRMMNKAFSGLLGHNAEELIGKSYLDVIHSEHQQEHKQLFEELLQGKREVFNQIKRYRQKDGSNRWVQVNIAGIYDQDDSKENILVIAFDISTEVTAKKEQQKLLALVENSSDLISVANMDGTITYMNDAGVKLLGMGSKASALTHNIRDIFAPEHLVELEKDIIPAVTRTGKWMGRQYYTQLETGEQMPFHTNAFRLDSPMSGEPVAIACVARDLRAELDVQQALLESEARFRSLVEEAPVATALFVGPRFIIEVANEPMIRFWGKGYSVLGKPLGVAVPELNDQPFMKILDTVYTSGVAHHEKEARSILVINGKPETFYFNFTYKPLLNAAGEVYAVVDMTIDVTDQVLARNKLLAYQSTLELEVAERTEELAASNEELAAMNEELQDANLSLVRSNQELEQYAYVASHDLQEPLRKIRIYADILNTRQDLPDHHKGLVEKINQSSERMSMLIKDLLEFSRLLEKGNMMREVDLTIMLQSVISDFELIIEEKHAEIIIGPLPVIKGIPLQINQLFYNLMSNALKFTQPDIRPVIEIKSTPISGELASVYMGKHERHKQYFDISFSDNGIGFEQKYADQIFEVFKRLHTRSQYPGSGIGLSLCRRIIANHSGHLYVESSPGKGSTFHIIIPGR
ncbi:PAS domain S-box protein [Chitinophaga filiformis]|uniref:PAS domain-containing sensor histidine kinase n=1 Tax=Chitinophaga filiformis TaxID=104663 RepID=UPI001F1A4394|nr:PAS domain S-box protein [Chitinophaga filiformis]MCF6401485.1 PAS domain S-box protein [Chitinophaga filiformis]